MRSRYLLLVGGFGLLTLLWIGYLFALQLFDPFQLDQQRLNRYTPHKEIIIPTRGAIYDANGNLLVSSISFYQIDIDRAAVKLWADEKKLELNEAYSIISKAIGDNCSVKPAEVMKRLTMNEKLSSILITNKVREMELERIVKAFETDKLPGLNHAFSSMRRIYSRDILAARLLGSVRAVSDGYDPETGNRSLYKLSGSCGIESSYDEYLAGEYGWREVVYDAKHRRMPYPGLHEKVARDGYNLRLTIDANIQEAVENALYAGLDKYRAKNAGAIVMDPHTGRILAMAGVSDEDKYIDPGLVRVKSNIPVSFMFEPGSTMKPLTMLVALDKHAVSHKDLFPSGSITIRGRRISDTHSYGMIRPVDIICKSSNVGIALIGDRIGAKTLYEKFIALGYGQKTGLELSGESSGMFAKLNNWDGYTLHSVSFGQGISVTALQHAAAFCAVANGGKMLKPYLLESVTDADGRVIEQFEPQVLRQVSSAAAADTVRHYMQTVVDRGTARHIKMDYITMAGKTGTAQKAAEGGGGYAGGKYNSVFVGMFPVEVPKMVLIVFYDEPASGYHYGSTSAAPTFKQIVENILFMPNSNILAFDERLLQSSKRMPDLRGKHISQAESILNQYGFSYMIEGADSSSVVVDQFPKPHVAIDPGHPITVKIGRKEGAAAETVVQGTMPDLRGLTLRRALQVAAREKVALRIRGSGVVRAQSIQPGSRVTKNTVCQLEASI
ncbi:MAG: penicillin-binding transpeptidase domain-containing protein [Candidatus Cloacimonetes bacterium]|nr:PASTA domain-containing protein [Candidatus Cloacimonadota bacterium]MDD4223411.1 penicillin-binding transpeptidase domain-containing protein [Candidatus Cloacimonadota bacterium]